MKDEATILLARILGKSIFFISTLFNFGSGGTWPGEIALKLDPNILSKIAPKNVILVAGTNGKTTTTLMIKHILGVNVVTNATGANLLNGIVSAIITSPQEDWGVFEVDENTLPQVLKFPKFVKSIKCIVLLNLFRDQLDRYGEVDTIVKNWQNVLKNYSGKLILNADDPQIATLGNKDSIYFGLEDQKLFQKLHEHAMDSQFCPLCGSRLKYTGHFYSHIGHWSCSKCLFSRPKPQITQAIYPLLGTYNRHNTLAAIAVAKFLGLNTDLTGFHPAFGRQEQVGDAKILLSKNPAGFNESLRTVLTMLSRGGLDKVMLVLNDRIPDGLDVSWIWDVDFEMIPKSLPITISGDRKYDLAVRLKYAGVKYEIVDLKSGCHKAKYILATYSAMLEVRKILTGRKIL